MNATAQIVLLAWAPLALVTFLVWPAPRAALFTYLAGWMFLPNLSIPIQGFVDYDKPTAIAIACVLGMLLTDSGSLARVRPRLSDLPIALLCLMPAISTLANGLDLYLAQSVTVPAIVTFGLPYFVGRVYFGTPRGNQELAIALLLGALVYAPLCLYEVRMSPQLHNTLYGFQQHSFLQTYRWGGYRPMVFMSHGLMVGLWMAMGTLISLLLWRCRGVRSVLQIPISTLLLGLLITTVLCRSSGAWALLAISIVGAYVATGLGTWLVHWLLLCSPASYVLLRIVGGWNGESVVEFVRQIAPARAESLAFRMEMEAALIQANQASAWLLGRGPLQFSVITNADGDAEAVVVDSLWIILYATTGSLSLLSLYLAFALPIWAMLRAVPARQGFGKTWVCTTALATCLLLFLQDCLANSMVNPVFFVVLGGLSGRLMGHRRP